MPQASQGVQPLVRNAVTQNSPDIRVSGLFASQSAHTGFTLYRSAPFGFRCCLLHKEAIQEGDDLGAGAVVVGAVGGVSGAAGDTIATAHMTASP